MNRIERQVASTYAAFLNALQTIESSSEAKAVKRVRTLSRRLQSALDYIHPQLSRKEKEALEKVSRLRKRAGKVRDCDVHLEMLDNFSNGSTKRERLAISARLEDRRQRQYKRLKSEADDFYRSKDRLRLRTRISKTKAAGLPAPLEEARKQLERLKAGATRFDLKIDDRLHQLRLQCKAARYLAELAPQSKVREAFVKPLRNVQDAVGEWHDWATLLEIVEKRLPNPATHPLNAEVRSMTAAKRAAAVSSVFQLLESEPLPATRKPVGSVRTKSARQAIG